jgi:hypothetical protein
VAQATKNSQIPSDTSGLMCHFYFWYFRMNVSINSLNMMWILIHTCDECCNLYSLMKLWELQMILVVVVL